MTKGNLPLLDLLYTAITEYKLIDEVNLEEIGFKIFIAQLDFVIYFFIEDELGLHCVEWTETASNIEEIKQYWTNRLNSGIYEAITYSIPIDNIKTHNRRLLPKKENKQ